MINKEFLKKVDVLYVEDDDIAREKLGKILKRLFNNVHIASNGIDGYLIFQKLFIKKTPIDLIISDINMPKMSGIEMLEQIRELDKDVPFIFTTARNESENLLRAIELNVNHYILKPIDIEDIVLKSQELCQKIYYEKLLSSKNRQIKEYLEAIEHTALIISMDEKGTIIHMSDTYLNELKIKEEDTLQKSFFDFIHPDNKKQLTDTILEHMQKEETFKETLKLIDTDDKPIYVNSTIFKINENGNSDFINIGFLNTKENLEKREFKKKVIKNIQEQNLKQSQSKEEIEKLHAAITKYETVLKIQQNEIDSLKKRNKLKLQQLEYYENELHEADEKQENILKLKNHQIKEYREYLGRIKSERTILLKKIQEKDEDIIAKRSDMEKLEQTIKLKDERIKNLEDIIKQRESQLKIIDPQLVLD